MSNKADLLFELGSEELPPKSLPSLSQALCDGFALGLKQAGLEHSTIRAFATPRRLALLVEDLSCMQPDETIERRGPALQAAFDNEGNATAAAKGFARSCQVNVDELIRITTDQGEWLGHRQIRKGRPAIELLPTIAEQALTKLPIAKRMRWGNHDFQFIRPVHWLVFLLGNDLVPCSLFGCDSTRYTQGHRFHHPDRLLISKPDEYEEKLKTQGYVIADFVKRKAHISAQIDKVCDTLTANVDKDGSLLDEVTALTEWPVAIVGSFEESFLQVPAQALILTMKQNQKYFPLFNNQGDLLNHFITFANIDSPKPELIKEGNERVIRPRLSDAKFFWDQDGKTSLASRVEGLKDVIFQKSLGSMYDKTLRVEKLALTIGNQLNLDQPLIQRSALLSRCDLLTEMVFEFPEMQGFMGRYQAQRDGEPDSVAQALLEFYLPRHAGDELPSSMIGQCIAIAERVDTLCGIFSIGMKPTGDKDPYGLRRASIGVIRILLEKKLPINFLSLIDVGISSQPNTENIDLSNLKNDITDFFLERLKGVLLDAGYNQTLINAVLATQPSQLPEIEAKLTALSAFMQEAHATQIIEANKRINNILKKLDGGIPETIDPALCLITSEQQLLNQMNKIGAEVVEHANVMDYSSCLHLLLSLKDPIDEFFDEVMVMTDDLDIRNNRLALLYRLRSMFLTVADLSYL